MDLLNEVASQGLLGLLLALSISGNVYLFKELQRSKEVRVSDLKEFNQRSIDSTLESHNTLTTILTIVQNLQDRETRRK